MSVFMAAVERKVVPVLSRRTAILSRRQALPQVSTHLQTPIRSFADAATEQETQQPQQQDDGPVALSTPRLQKLYEDIIQLPKSEVSILGALILQILGQKIYPGEFGTPGGAVAEGGEDGAAAEVVEEVKTIFDLKLVGFDAKAKIKVIKEVRAITGLGLKEAKEKVESAPTVLSKDIKQEQADELKEKLEAVGAQVEIV